MCAGNLEQLARVWVDDAPDGSQCPMPRPAACPTYQSQVSTQRLLIVQTACREATTRDCFCLLLISMCRAEQDTPLTG